MLIILETWFHEPYFHVWNILRDGKSSWSGYYGNITTEGFDPGKIADQRAWLRTGERLTKSQFLTYYQHPDGYQRLRVTTVARDVSSPSNKLTIAQSFDQEAAAVLMARIAMFKGEVNNGPDVVYWLDRMLVKLCSRFAVSFSVNASGLRYNVLTRS
jgi:hypothetical protein